MVAVGFSPRLAARVERASRSDAGTDGHRLQASLRDARLDRPIPWVETHGYPRSIAPRWAALEGGSSVVPDGTRPGQRALPPMNRWAFLFRPSGLGSVGMAPRGRAARAAGRKRGEKFSQARQPRQNSPGQRPSGGWDASAGAGAAGVAQGVDLPIRLGVSPAQGFEEPFPIRVISEDGFAPCVEACPNRGMISICGTDPCYGFPGE